MRVLFDAYWWVEGPSAVRRVMKKIILTWRDVYVDDEIALVVRRQHADLVRGDVGPGIPLFVSSTRPQALLATVGMLIPTQKFRPDVVITHNFAMPGPRSMVYLHDLMFLTNPEWFTKRERAYFSAMAPLARRAGIVLTSSEAEAARIRRFVPGRPVAAVGIGIDDELVGLSELHSVAGLRPRGYILAVGRLNQRKNLGRVLEAALSDGLTSVDFPMVVVGEPDGASAELPYEAKRAESVGQLVFLGFVSDEELQWLYSNARLTTYVSLDEGYGMPPFESLALGTPAVVSDIAVMRESHGDHVRYANPHDVHSIRRAIRSELETPLSREREMSLIRHGKSRSWTSVVASIRQRSVSASRQGGYRRAD